MNIEQTFGVCVILTGSAFGAAVVYREFTADRCLWKLARVLGTLGFVCWLCFGYRAIRECEVAYRTAAHWQQMAAVHGNGIGVFASQREVQTAGGSVIQWERTSAGPSRPVLRAAERIGRGNSGIGCGCIIGSGTCGGFDSLRGIEQSGADGNEGNRL